MASTEQPPKKRKIYEPLPESPPSSPPPPPLPPASEATLSVPSSPQQTLPPPPTPPPSQEDIVAKRHNKDEVRSVNECLKRIKFCLSQKDERSFMSDLEHSYLALITASRGFRMFEELAPELESSS